MHHCNTYLSTYNFTYVSAQRTNFSILTTSANYPQTMLRSLAFIAAAFALAAATATTAEAPVTYVPLQGDWSR
jgi:hypothetical protein